MCAYDRKAGAKVDAKWISRGYLVNKEDIKMYDMIIIGAGPAGISAAIYGKSRGKKSFGVRKEAGGWFDWYGIYSHTLCSNCARRNWQYICGTNEKSRR